MDSHFLQKVGKLAERETRQENATILAQSLGAEDLVILLHDSQANMHLPAPGFRQTFQDGLKARAFLEDCFKQGSSQASFRFTPGSSHESVVQGRTISDGSILAVSGGNLSQEKLAELSHLLPILNSAFSCEREIHQLRAQSKILTSAMMESEAYAKALEQTRLQLASTLFELKKSETQVRDLAEKSLEDLKTLQNERDLREQFVATLTHDLRSPMTAARMSAQLILRKSSDEQINRLSSKVVGSLDRADHMIQDLLDANLIRAGEKIPLNIEKCDLHAVAKDTIEDLITTHGDRFILKSTETIEGFWSCSAIRRVLENLATNGIKYGSPYSSVTISISKLDQNLVSVSVHNQGNPLSEEDITTIFEPYRRTSSAKTGQQKGWGLGLTLVKGIVEAHNGKTNVESSPEEGTTFTVLLPLDSR